MAGHADRPFCGYIPRIVRRLPGLARRTRGIPVPVYADPSHDPAPGRAARDTDTGAAAGAARERMREFMSRAGGRGVTVTMIVNVLAGVPRSTITRWLAEDIKRGAAERVMPGFYRTRPHSDRGNQHRGRRGRLAHPGHLEAA